MGEEWDRAFEAGYDHAQDVIEVLIAERDRYKAALEAAKWRVMQSSHGMGRDIAKICEDAIAPTNTKGE